MTGGGVMSAADRMRRYRARRSNGQIPITVDVDEVSLAETLIAGGFLSRSKADDRQALREAAERFLASAVAADFFPKP